MKTPKSTLLTQILFATLIPMLVVFVLVLINITQAVSALGANAAREKSTYMADIVSRQMQTVFDTFAVQVNMLGKSLEIVCGESHAARETAKRLASALIESNPDVYCVWFVFEPGSFLPENRFKGSFLRRGGAVVEFLDDLSEADLDNPEQSPWYTIPLESGRPYFEGVDYYDYGKGFEYSGTITYPVFVDDKVVGCVGLDVHYEQIFGFLREPEHSNGSLINLVAENGEIIYSNAGAADMIHTNLLERLAGKGEVAHVRSGLEVHEAKQYAGQSLLSDQEVLANLVPIALPHSSRRLSLLMETSSRELVAESTRAKYILLLTSVVGVALLAAAVYLVTRNIVKPMRQIVDRAEEIAAGNHESYKPIFDHTQESGNEVYILEQSIRAILGQLKEKYQFELAAMQARTERENIAAAAEAKMQFFASMSHEIRTPMNAVLGLSQILMDQPLTEEQKRHVGDIKVSAESLLRVINDVLDLSRMEIGKLELVRECFDLHALIDSLVSIFTVLSRQKGLTFELSLAPDVPQHIIGDQHRCRQILTNILGNAVKFTREGMVRLVVKADPECMIFDIADSGPGVCEEEREHLFQPYKQLKSEHKAHGSGLGLSISIGLAKAMGGGISLEDAGGGGSLFRVWLPYVAAEDEEFPGEDRGTVVRFRHSARVLVVDDNRINLVAAKGLIGKFGIRCDTAMSGREAIARIAEDDYDIVFMDYMMPEMDGMETTVAIRDLGGRCAEMPIIALTANIVAVGRDAFLAAGMNDMLAKPIEVEKLRAVLRRWIPEDKQYREAP